MHSPMPWLVAAALFVPGTLPAQFVFESLRLQHLPTDGLLGGGSSFADFDGDGDLDIVANVSNLTAGRLRFHRNDGHGVFTPYAPWPDVLNAGGHLVADIDSDGDPDVVLNGAIVRNLGGGALQVIAVPATGQPIACADFDGDGVRDLFVTTNGAYGVALFRQVGGTFVPMPVPTTNVALANAAARDFDGDGDTDLLLAANRYVIGIGVSWPGNDRLWRNNGLGQFVEQYLPGALDADTPGLVVADFDGDGDHDCALQVFSPLAFGWQLRLNDGLGNLLLTTGHLPANVPMESLRAVDLDADGDQDLAGPTSWLENDGTAHFTLRAYTLVTPMVPVLAHGDVDADGDSDLVVASQQPHRLLLNVGPGRFADGSRRPWNRASVGHGDFDSDGDVDLLAVPERYAVGINDGTGWFTDAPFPWPTNGQVLLPSIRIVDADGDGDRDVLCVFWPWTGGAQLRLFRNNGSATFVDAGQTGMPPSLPSDISAAATLDADGDGDLDLVLVARLVGVFLYANSGTGGFTAVPGAFPPYAGWLRAIGVGDLDSDGDADVLTGDLPTGGGPPSAIRYFANDGTGVFTDVSAQRLQAPTAQTVDFAIADLDGDGDLDAFAACVAAFNSANLLLLNTGSGVLVHQPTALPAVQAAGTVALGDLDHDGDLDAVAGTAYGGVRIWRNQGAATFVDVGGISAPLNTSGNQGFLTADVDDDTDIDLLVGDGVLTNAHWGASRSLLCRTGEPFPYAVRTLTNATLALPFFGLQFARVPLPPFGTLAMPVGSPLLLPALALTNGAGQVSYPIPPDPGLIGLEFVLQSLFLGGTSVHLSPAVRVPVVD